jgi:hypothetical protein
VIPVLVALVHAAPLPPPDASWPVELDGTRRHPVAVELAGGIAVDGRASVGLLAEARLWALDLAALGLGAWVGGPEGVDPDRTDADPLGLRPYVVADLRLLTWKQRAGVDLVARIIPGAPTQLGVGAEACVTGDHVLRASVLSNFHHPTFEVSYGYRFQ